MLDHIIPAALANHLWQSTLFAAATMLLTLVLRKNRSQTRYVLWLIASLKFLVPFAVLVAVGSQIKWPSAAPIAHAAIPASVEQIGQPFSFTDWASTSTPTATSNPIPTVLFIVWLCGFIAVLAHWLRCWMRARATVRSATPVSIDAPIRVLSSPSLIEPGVFGIFRPVLLLPAGINRHLTASHLEAILAHELCHVRRRDNLMAALHMLVEALFWFHPLVWWIGARLLEERERACDEEVLRLGNQPGVYAESILKICQFYLASPAFVAGVTGADLKKRIVRIMTGYNAMHLNARKKFLLTAAGLMAIALPLVIGAVHAAGNQIQPEPVKLPEFEFEVAAIKVNNSGRNSSHWRDHSGKMFANNISLEQLIQRAYGLRDYQISGPDWLKSARYDIEAETSPSTTKEQYALMIRHLLLERFKLTAHRDQKVLPVYALMVAKNGPKLQRVNEQGHSSVNSSRNHISLEVGSMTTIADSLSRHTDRPVIDETEVTGSFKGELSWTPDDNQGSSTDQPATAALDSGASIFTALEEQWGLKLVPKKAPTEILVIDHVEKIPTEN